MGKRSTTGTQNCHPTTQLSDWEQWCPLEIRAQKLVCFWFWYLIHLSVPANVRTWDFCVYYKRDVVVSLRRNETEKAFLLGPNDLTSKTTLCSSVESKATWGELLQSYSLRRARESRFNSSSCSCKTWFNLLATSIAHCQSGDRRKGGRFFPQEQKLW